MILLSRTDRVLSEGTSCRASVLAILAATLCVGGLTACGGSAEEPGSRPVAAANSSSTSSTPSPSGGTQAAASTGAPAPATTVATQAAGTAPQNGSQTAARADAVCVKRNHELKSSPLDAGSPSSIASNASRRAAIEQHALAELNALSPPTGKTKQWKTMIEQTNEALEDASKLAGAARAGNAGGTTRGLTVATRTQLRLLAAAADVGAKHCVQVG